MVLVQDMLGQWECEVIFTAQCFRYHTRFANFFCHAAHVINKGLKTVLSYN